MFVILVLLTFAAFLALDYFVSLERVLDQVAPVQPVKKVAAVTIEDEPIGEPVFVAGYELPQQFHYHQGHTWARRIANNTVTIGLDDFARRLIGTAEGVEVPRVGTELKQGAPAFRVVSEGRGAQLVSPVRGRILEVNHEIAHNPALCTEDPYRKGWLMKVEVPDLDDNLRNLLAGSLACKWMEDSRGQLEHRLMALSGSVLQDGGEPARDFARHLKEEDWKRLIEVFLMTIPKLG